MGPDHTSTRRADALALVALGALLACGYSSFFGAYAFDDSYVGYSNAENLLRGNGMVFDPGSRALTTSAPLAVPLYALMSIVLHASVVNAAQLVSAGVLAVIAFAAYAVCRRFTTPTGAFCGASAVLCSPFILLLWSHESLVAAAVLLLSALAFAYARPIVGAFTLGAASLLRAEAIVALPFFCYAEYRRSGLRAALTGAIAGILPLAAWTVFAFRRFGTPTSLTLQSKQAQFVYYDITPYLFGTVDFVRRIYSPGGSALILGILLIAIGAGIWLLAHDRSAWARHLAVASWCLATTLVYVVLELPFYFWFGLQWAALCGYVAAASFPTTARADSLRERIGIGVAVVLAALNIQFLATQLIVPEMKSTYYDWVIMPDIRANNYRALGTWLARNTPHGATFTYPEFGQVHYYADRPLVDYLGIATPGAAEHLRVGDAIWTFKKYHPDYYIDDRTWWYFANPLEFDWFRRAYRPVTQLHLGGDAMRRDFRIYRLFDAAMIPKPDDVDNAAVSAARQTRDGFAFDVTPAHDGMDAVAVRLFFRSACARTVVELYRHGRSIASTSEPIADELAVTRVSLPVASSVFAGTALQLVVHDCNAAALAPPVLLRHGFIVFGKPAGVFGGSADAVTVYHRP